MRLSCLSPSPAWTRLAISPLRSPSYTRCSSSTPLDFRSIDAKWQPRWKDHSLWSSRDAPSGNYFVMPMFPYPSGALHIGHLRNYTISDVIARFRRMSGHHVLHPLGWDAFGLPAENAAIERGVAPSDWTMRNIQSMKTQIDAMGGCWDWDKELRTCDLDFYKDTQRLFLQLYRHGLAYRDEAVVNYDPVDKTVLANEQVDANGCSWRSGAKVQQLKLRQWFVKITDYAQELLDDMSRLEADNKWPARVVAMQKNWLGRSEGASMTFDVHVHGNDDLQVPVFTTRADTLFGVQYVALSLQHPTVAAAAERDVALQKFIADAPSKDLDTKLGYRLVNVSATNPLAKLYPDDTRFKTLPVFAAPYVRSDYGSGAVMGVPAHDARDFAFWELNRTASEETSRQVVMDLSVDDGGVLSEAVVAKGKLNHRCASYAGLHSDQAVKQIVSDIQNVRPGAARETVSWRMRDWLISRQRYWGTPIPIIHCDACGTVPVPDADLPVELPLLSDDEWKGLRGNALESNDEWRSVACPECQRPATRETDTMDTFVDSSWYFLRFAESARKAGAAQPLMPVDLYIGGVEHAILHLLYSRFISKFLAKVTDQPALSEPFDRLLTQGMVHGKTYSDPDSGRFLKPDEVDLRDSSNPIVKDTGKTANVSFEKMSKSKHNGVDPLSCIAAYGADTTRAHLLFQAPVSDVLEWDEAKIAGIQRWFNRLWALAHDFGGLLQNSALRDTPLPRTYEKISDGGIELWKQTQMTITSVKQSYGETYALNTVVSDLMSLTNAIQQSSQNAKSVSEPERRLLVQALSVTIRLLTPIAPSFAEECWSTLHGLSDGDWSAANTASRSGFPEPDGSLERLQARSQPCAVQVNGKLKFVAQIPSAPEGLAGDALRDWTVAKVVESPEGSEALLRSKFDPKGARKIIVVRGGRTLNFVT